MSRKMYVTTLPGRKRKALVVEEDNVITVLAYFQSEEALQTFMSFEPWYKEES